MRILFHAVAALLLLGQAPAPPYRTLDDRFPPPAVRTRAEWDQRAAYLREHVLASAGLLPLPARTPLRPVVFDAVSHPDYRVSKVYFESLPGFLVTGNLYQPIGNGPFPAVLSPHGHWTYGRLENSPLVSGPGRAIGLARQGFVVFSYDMVGYNDSRQLTHSFGGRRETLWGLSLAGLQLWNGIRAIDFVESLPFVQKDAIGATGESGGGTQTFLLAAADPRIAAAAPVNMVSLHMQGGCLCENPPGLRLDTTNVEIAATIAPRPLLMISATGDWTNETLEREYPAVRRIYGLLGAEERVSAVRFDAEHNYNKDSREAMYAFMVRWLKHGPPEARLPEKSFNPDSLPDLLVFHRRPLPAGAVTAEALTDGWIDAARGQLASTPLAVRAAALRHSLAFAESRGAGAQGGQGAGPDAVSSGRRTAGSAGARRGRPTVLLAGETGAVGAKLRAAGYAVRAIRFTPFDEQAAAKVKHFETYNRTPASQRVADVVAALRADPDAIVVGAGDEALAAALASAIAPPRLAVLDVKGFDGGRDTDFVEHLYIPGLRRAGDFRTATELASGRLVIHGAGAGLEVPAAKVQRAVLSDAEIVSLVRRSAQGAPREANGR